MRKTQKLLYLLAAYVRFSRRHRLVLRGVWVQDDRRHGRADGAREFRDKGESVGVGPDE